MENSALTGRVHSFQSMGAVDGPGLRYVVFFQGCPLRCAYCHNPDTWAFGGGQEVTVEDVLQKVRRCAPYIKKNGGVTLTGGEPLAQSGFAAALLAALKAEGFHTAVDTSGAASLADAEQVLAHTDLVLADLKFTTEEDYRRHTGGSLLKHEPDNFCLVLLDHIFLAVIAVTEDFLVPDAVCAVLVGLADSPFGVFR